MRLTLLTLIAVVVLAAPAAAGKPALLKLSVAENVAEDHAATFESAFSEEDAIIADVTDCSRESRRHVRCTIEYVDWPEASPDPRDCSIALHVRKVRRASGKGWRVTSDADPALCVVQPEDLGEDDAEDEPGEE